MDETDCKQTLEGGRKVETSKPVRTFGTLIYVAALIFALVVMHFGCGGAVQLTQQEKDALSLQAQARQDSIAEFELNKTWSFGFSNYQNKEYTRAIPYMRKIIEIDKKHKYKDVYSVLSQSYFKLSQVDSALQVLLLGVKVFPENESMHSQLAYIYDNKQEQEKAIAEYEICARLNPAKVQYRSRLAELYTRTNNSEKAIASYRKLIELEPNKVQHKNDLNALLQSSGDMDEVVENMKKMLAADPENPNLLLELAGFYKRNEEWGSATDYYERYLAQNADDQMIRTDLASIYMRNENFAKAISTFDKMLAANANNVAAIAGQADAYRELGQLQKALRLAKKASKLDKNYGMAHIIIGRIYEDAVDKCQSAAGRTGANIYDKLVYAMANRQYMLAAKDLSTKSRAESRMHSLEPVLPSKGDMFMHKGKTIAGSTCHSWLY